MAAKRDDPSRRGVPDAAGQAPDAAVWEAVGVLAAGHSLELTEAFSRIWVRAIELRVPAEDVAEFVLWRGVLPD